ncbi:hypothetical protein H072_10267 [Dactylellina haptotyla CBS 200.50]|uniref:CCHC-type domain-containing protein n=1 Tax=Dactylellina haptotyla (strain CBS 200.50) TaxID=1284197 RepID=S7ZZQ6_DACHA|nr:hypothetical protein H072_10267 [Dactylellina haptotyla CBS 200.50]
MEGVPGPGVVDDGASTNEPKVKEVMDLTVDTTPYNTQLAAVILEEPKEQPLGTQEMRKFAKGTLEALGADENEKPPPARLRDEWSDSSDDDNEMIDDSGITLNLQEDVEEENRPEQPETILIDSSSDEEEPVKGRSKRTTASPNFSGPESKVEPETTKSNGAIAVSTGLKLGKAGKANTGIAKITRRPLAESISAGEVQVVDYSQTGSANGPALNARVLKGLSPSLPTRKPSSNGEVEVIDLVSDPVEIPTENAISDANKRAEPLETQSDADNDYSDDDAASSESESDDDDANHSDGAGDFIQLDDDDDEEEEGVISDNDSAVSSVDTDIWSIQQRYYVKQPSPPLLHEDSRDLFTEDMSGRTAAQKTLEKVLSQSEPKKRKICDICMEPHLTEQCDMLKCDVCQSSNEHFSFHCPYKTSAHKSLSDLPICNVPAGQKDFEIWRILPPRATQPAKKASKIPMSCYECGDDNHFGDDCPTFGRNRNSISSSSIWSAKSAAGWSTMNMESKYARRTGKNTPKTQEPDDGELGWFEARIQAAKAAIPDTDLKRDFADQMASAPQRSRGGNGNGGTRGSIQMNLPRSFPGQGHGDNGSNSFTRFQPSNNSGGGGGRFADRVGPRGGDSHYRPEHSRRDRSRSPRRPSLCDRVGGFSNQGNYRDRSHDFPRGNGPAPPRGNQNYHAVPPPPPPSSTYQPQYSQQGNSSSGGGWALPGSIQRSIQDSGQPPLPPGPPPGPPPRALGGGHRGGRGGRGGYRGGKRHR